MHATWDEKGQIIALDNYVKSPHGLNWRNTMPHNSLQLTMHLYEDFILPITPTSTKHLQECNVILQFYSFLLPLYKKGRRKMVKDQIFAPTTKFLLCHSIIISPCKTKLDTP